MVKPMHGEEAEQRSNWVLQINLPPPSLTNNTADADRLCEGFTSATGIKHVSVDLEVLRKIPALIRSGGFRCRVLYWKDEKGALIYHIASSEPRSFLLGVAIDIGTTSLAFRLVNLETSDILAESVIDNPQISIATDILGRVHHCDSEEGLFALQRMIVCAVQREIDLLSRRAHTRLNEVFLISVAGNTVMTHLFMGLSPKWIIREPYIPVINTPGLFRASELGIMVHPSARIYVFPNVGSYFGGDLIAGILHSGMCRSEKISLLMDVGTNAEVVIGNRNWLIACAGAAGPALEGGVSKIGMKAGKGAIDHIAIHPEKGTINCRTIGNVSPVGICGSGVIDLAAELFLSGMIDRRGKFVKERLKDRLMEKEGVDHLLVVSGDDSGTKGDLTFSQLDLDSLIRSKAAMYAILETVTTEVGISFEDISCWYIAGTFGAYIRPRSAIAIGMIPDFPDGSFVILNNSSLGGSTHLLHSSQAPIEIQKIRQMTTYVELNVNQAFMSRFSAARFIPHTDCNRFPSIMNV